MKSENVYTSVACNRTTECADWGNNGLIVFGACNAVAICDPKFARGQTAKILHTFVRHTKRVNTVQWLRNGEGSEKEIHFLSGADDGLALLWNIENVDAPRCHTLKGHESGVNAVGGLWRSLTKTWLLATAAADSTLRIWRFDGVSETAECIQTLHLNSGFCFALRLVALPTAPQQALLAFSADDETVALWAQTEAVAANDGVDTPFRLVHKLRGHEDWVRGLDFVRDDDDLLLASSAQDNFIRLWRIAPRTEEQVRANSSDFARLLNEGVQVGKSKDDLLEIRVEEKIVVLGSSAADCSYAVSLESVLYGHEGWVYGVHWHKSEEMGLRLLSASIDKTLIIWAPNSDDGIWMEQVRVGEVGGNSLGFFGGKFASDGKSIFGHSYSGGFHIWQQDEQQQQQQESESTATTAQRWTPQVIVGGHYGEVRDLAWEPQGEYLLTISADQTTRLHAPWRRQSTPSNDDDEEVVTWHELARPQVHGYDMQALAMLSRYKFASGAEEKIVRTFQAPANFIENFRNITQTHNDAEGDALLTTLPKGASVPSLGLSNKAVYSTESAATPAAERHVKDHYPENYFEAISLTTPPQEEALMQNTLWPEVQKLYGHGYEIYALAATRDGSLLASSCRSSNAEHAQIILWNPANWKQIQKLPSHQLTVTQLRFSRDGRYLLSVSRDRRWSLFERQQPTDASNPSAVANFALAAGSDKTNGVHARIIWSCDWSHDSQMFATASRDGKVAIWQHKSEAAAAAVEKSTLKGWQAAGVLELKNESITAVAFAPHQLPGGAFVVALGCELGLIRIYSFVRAAEGDDGLWTLLLTLSNAQSHHLTVRRLQFRPTAAAPKNCFHLASCGDDNLTRIYKLDL